MLLFFVLKRFSELEKRCEYDKYTQWQHSKKWKALQMCSLRWNFQVGGKLQRHLKIHSEERPNQLTQCDKNFRTAGNLNPRLQVYSGQKSFKCTQCDRSVNQFETSHDDTQWWETLQMYLMWQKLQNCVAFEILAWGFSDARSPLNMRAL